MLIIFKFKVILCLLINFSNFWYEINIKGISFNYISFFEYIYKENGIKVLDI